MPPVGTDQPLSCRAPAPPPHQEVPSRAQSCQQEPRGDQSRQCLPRKVLVAPHAAPFEGFDSELKKKKRKEHCQREPRASQTGNVCVCSAASKQSCSSPPWEMHTNKAGLCCLSSVLRSQCSICCCTLRFATPHLRFRARICMDGVSVSCCSSAGCLHLDTWSSALGAGSSLTAVLRAGIN